MAVEIRYLSDMILVLEICIVINFCKILFKKIQQIPKNKIYFIFSWTFCNIFIYKYYFRANMLQKV